MNMRKKLFFKFFLAIWCFSMASFLSAQDDLMDMLEEEVGEETLYVSYTFKSTRIINGHSIERVRAKQLDFRANHRFGEIKSGVYELWGLDNALINFSLEYGVTDWLMIGIRRGTYQKAYDGSLKFSLLRQSTGKINMPISVSYYTDMSIKTLKLGDPTQEDLIKHRLAYVHQILAGRKFNENLSLQLSPTYVHRNLVKYDEVNDVYAMGIGGRYRLTRRLNLMFEYFYTSHAAKNDQFYNPLSLGVDLETGGHVFQLFLTNSRAMLEKGVMAETTGSWMDGSIYFGFNISRMFSISRGKNH